MRDHYIANHASFLVRHWRAAGQPERASAALAQIELADREKMAKAETDTERAQLLRIQAYFQFSSLKDMERAERTWEEALALDPERPKPNAVRAEWLRVLGKHQAALDELNRLHRAKPDPLLLRSCLIEAPDGEFAEELRAALK